MVNLDVTELFFDSDLADQTFDVFTQVITTNNKGRSVITPTTIAGVIGAVQPAKTRDLQRLPEGAYQKGALTIWTTYALTAGGKGRTADKIRWPSTTGPMYVIQDLEDYSQFGGGFVKATATLVDLNP